VGASFFGTPRRSVVHSSGAQEAADVTLAPQLLAILVCPKCKGPLQYRERESALDCLACRLRYAVRDDIPIMLIDEATPL
jgi:hypothetical protein